MLSLFNEVKNITLHKNIDVGKMTTIKSSAIGDLIEVHTIESLQQVKKILFKKNLKNFVIGKGSNLIVLNTKDTIFLKLNMECEDLDEEKSGQWINANYPLNKLTAHAIKYGLKGWECWTGIPGTLGGAIYMNAGTSLGEIGPLIKEVKLINKCGELKKLKLSQEDFSYRKNHFCEDGDIIVSAYMVDCGKDENIKSLIKNYLQKRKQTQPLGSKNCGCVFKNNESFPAGKAIDDAGLKGHFYKGSQVSELHGNFLENTKDASSKDIVEHIRWVQNELESKTGEKFELEVKVY